MSSNAEWCKEQLLKIINRQQNIIVSYDLYNEKYVSVLGGKEEPAILWAIVSMIGDHNKAIYTLTRELLDGLDNLHHIPVGPFETIYLFIPDIGGAWLTIDPSIPVPVHMDGYVVEPTVLRLGGLPSGTMVFTNNITITIP